ncbi:MAG TPA: hypothetical protein VG293_05950 [Solirubrobacteraceae bacterium]|nr:hypothetical protein [Solirubrobacteraceae bacterium]
MTDPNPSNDVSLHTGRLGETTELAAEIWRQQASLAYGMRLAIERGEEFTDQQRATITQLLGTVDSVQAQVAELCEAVVSFLRRDILKLDPDQQIDQLRQWKLVTETQVAGVELATELHMLRKAWAGAARS